MNLPTKEEWEAAARCMYVHGERVHIVEAVRAIARGDLVVCTDSGPDGWTGRYKPATSIPDEK